MVLILLFHAFARGWFWCYLYWGHFGWLLFYFIHYNKIWNQEYTWALGRMISQTLSSCRSSSINSSIWIRDKSENNITRIQTNSETKKLGTQSFLEMLLQSTVTKATEWPSNRLLASCAQGCGFNPWAIHTKDGTQMVLDASLLGTQH